MDQRCQGRRQICSKRSCSFFLQTWHDNLHLTVDPIFLKPPDVIHGKILSLVSENGLVKAITHRLLDHHVDHILSDLELDSVNFAFL